MPKFLCEISHSLKVNFLMLTYHLDLTNLALFWASIPDKIVNLGMLIISSKDVTLKFSSLISESYFMIVFSFFFRDRDALFRNSSYGSYHFYVKCILSVCIWCMYLKIVLLISCLQNLEAIFRYFKNTYEYQNECFQANLH